MLPTRVLSLLALLCFGCHSAMSPPDLAGPDLGAAADLAATVKLSCAQMVACLTGCGQMGATCLAGCVTNGSTTGQTKFAVVSLCIAQMCSLTVDGGAALCTNPGSSGCLQCVQAKCGSALLDCLAN